MWPYRSGPPTPADQYYSYYVGVYNATGNLTAFFSAGAYSNPPGLAFINDTIYTSNLNNGSYLDMYSSAGVYKGNFTTPAFLSTTSLGHLQYVPSTTAGAAGALWVQLIDVNQIVAVDLATHARLLESAWSGVHQRHHLHIEPQQRQLPRHVQLGRRVQGQLHHARVPQHPPAWATCSTCRRPLRALQARCGCS